VQMTKLRDARMNASLLPLGGQKMSQPHQFGRVGQSAVCMHMLLSQYLPVTEKGTFIDNYHDSKLRYDTLCKQRS